MCYCVCFIFVHAAFVRIKLMMMMMMMMIMQGTMSGARMRGRPPTAWMDYIKTWKKLTVEESVRMTEDKDKWRKYVHWCGHLSN